MRASIAAARECSISETAMLASIGFILQMHTGTVVFRPTLDSYKGEMYERFPRINALFFDFLYFQLFSVTKSLWA